MEAGFLKRGLLRLISDCTVEPASAVSAFACAGEVYQEESDRVGEFLYDVKNAATYFGPQLQTKSLKRGLRGVSLPGVVHVKVVPRYVEEFSNAYMSRVFVKTV